MRQTTTKITCHGWTQHYDGQIAQVDDDFEVEIEFKHREGIDDAHLAKLAWDFAYNEISEYDFENLVDTKVLSKICMCGEEGEFEVDSLHRYPCYVGVDHD